MSSKFKYLLVFISLYAFFSFASGVKASCFSSIASGPYQACVSGGGVQCGADSNGNQTCCNNGTTCTSFLTNSGGPSGTGTIGGRCGSNFIDTAIGCIPINDENALVGFLLRWGIGIGGGIAFLLILIAGFQIMTSRGDPTKLKAGQELLTSAIAGLLLLIFGLVILRIIGVDILGLTGFGQ